LRLAEIPVERDIRNKIREMKGSLTYSEFFEVSLGLKKLMKKNEDAVFETTSSFEETTRLRRALNE